MSSAEKTRTGSPDLIQVRRALDFAANAHQDQVQVHTGEPFIYHPIAVAKIVAEISEDPDLLTVALLHDVVNETPCTSAAIEQAFGSRIAGIISAVTEVSAPANGRRAVGWAIDRRHLAQTSATVQTIKLADMIDNCRSMLACNSEFAQVYLAGQNDLLEVLTRGDARLHDRASEMVREYRAH